MAAGTSHATLKTFPVILHIYDVSHFNPLLRACSGFYHSAIEGNLVISHILSHFNQACSGFYRSAIEVHGVEYMFLDYIDDNGQRGGRLLIRNPSHYTTINKGLKLHQSIVVGRTQRSNVEANRGIRGLSVNYAYNHVQNNSHHYAERVWDLLVGNTSGIQSLQWLRQCDSLENEYDFLKVQVWNNMLNVDERRTATFPVVLHVYKVPCGTMRRLFGSELSFYRSSVEVHGVEYMFCEHDGVAGIAMTTPRRMADEKDLEFKKSIVMGRTEKNSAAEVNKVVEEVGRAGGYGAYPRNVYSYISKNCHHFSDNLCNVLVRKCIPGWIKRATFYERNYTGEALTAREKQGRKDPRKWGDGTLFMSWNPPRDYCLVRMLNCMNTNVEQPIEV